MKEFWNNLSTGHKIFLGVAVAAIIATIVIHTGFTPDNQPEAIEESVND